MCILILITFFQFVLPSAYTGGLIVIEKKYFIVKVETPQTKLSRESIWLNTDGRCLMYTTAGLICLKLPVNRNAAMIVQLSGELTH